MLGIDSDARTVELLSRGQGYLTHVDGNSSQARLSERFAITTDTRALEKSDVVLVCVPTPLGPHREPDLRFVLGSTRAIRQVLHRSQLVLLTSTTYPGTTR